jgi:hypothetical protein
MEQARLGTWLRRLRGTATIVYIAALCAAVSLAVLAFIPRSPVTLQLPTASLSRLDSLGGLTRGVVVDPSGGIVFKVVDPSLGQRMLYLATVLPGVLLVAWIARRMEQLLLAAQDSDPFTERTARELTSIAKITAFGGLGVWAVGVGAKAALSATMLVSGRAVGPLQWPVWWLAVGLIFAAFGQLVARGVAMRAELDSVI